MGFDVNVLNGVLQPVSKATGLPNEFYIDQQTFDAEREHVFFGNWAAMGFAADVPEQANAKPVTFLGMPLLMVRGQDGQVRVFQNTCRHRGMILVEEPKKMRGVIRCPYHSWCYDLKGALKTTPHVGGPGQNMHHEIDRDALGLIEIRSHVWQDVVFVNISGDAPPFEEAASELLERWSEFEKPSYFGGADSTFELKVKCNWKLAVENYCESYHLPWVHPGLNSYSRLEDHYHIMEQGRFAGQGTVVYDPKLSDNQAFANYDGLAEKWDKSAEYIALFPNVLLGVHRDHRFAIILVPDDIGNTTERIALYYADESMTGDEYADLRAKNAALWKEVFEEDIFVVEGMQAGRHGRYFDGGKFSPVMDEPTWVFHHWVASQMLKAGEGVAG
ncbi:aromatic ring-hydroxylating dioxygenase subunit alpha [Pseudahrensia aquimaris]|uniref:Aromatic ring-hydroxylating dioxygenase subunit alpha n=1 Tax=Pseudahrensia aquimaris TaxID=744461 RepID=A0ABW3FD59_9HYPH